MEACYICEGIVGQPEGYRVAEKRGEHCGMLHVPSYRRCRDEKLAWYKVNGILPREEVAGRTAL